ESRPDEGSTFWFTIRCRAFDAALPAYLESRPPDLAGRSLLVVTEAPQAERLLRWYADRWGMTLMTARLELEALALLQDSTWPDAALIDLTGGTLEGLERALAAAGVPFAHLLPLSAQATRGDHPDGSLM